MQIHIEVLFMRSFFLITFDDMAWCEEHI